MEFKPTIFVMQQSVGETKRYAHPEIVTKLKFEMHDIWIFGEHRVVNGNEKGDSYGKTGSLFGTIQRHGSLISY